MHICDRPSFPCIPGNYSFPYVFSVYMRDAAFFFNPHLCGKYSDVSVYSWKLLLYICFKYKGHFQFHWRLASSVSTISEKDLSRYRTIWARNLIWMIWIWYRNDWVKIVTNWFDKSSQVNWLNNFNYSKKNGIHFFDIVQILMNNFFHQMFDLVVFFIKWGCGARPGRSDKSSYRLL